jgi:hypothetical protein
MIEFRDWAKGQLTENHVASIYDWQNMPLSEMASRALAICEEARNASVGDSLPVIFAFQCLEAMAKQLKEKYPPKRSRGW